MRKAILITLVLLLGNAHSAAALEPPVSINNVLIVEVQTGSVATGTEEFIELFNPSNQPVDITGWQLQYRPASALPTSAWAASHTKATVTCTPAPGESLCAEVIAPQSRKVFTTFAMTSPTLPMNGGFAVAGGQIRLIRPTQTGPEQVDMLGYGTAATFESTAAAPAPEAGRSLKRLVQIDAFVDSNDNAQDFFVDCGQPTPGQQTPPQVPALGDSCDPQPEEPAPLPEPDPVPPVVEDPPVEPGQGGEPTVFLPLQVTEVFPDPVSPQQDGSDEFVEIYNPNDAPVNLEDYMIQTGNTFQYKVTLGDFLLAPHAFAVVTSGDSSLSLSNTGTAVRLADPNGEVRDEAPNFGKAVAGSSWVKQGDGWHWSTTITPAALNILTAPTPKPAAKKVKSASATKATPKTDVAQPVAPAATPEVQETSEPAFKTAAAITSRPNYWLLGLVGAAALTYGLFEYRQDVARLLANIRSKFRRPRPDGENS